MKRQLPLILAASTALLVTGAAFAQPGPRMMGAGGPGGHAGFAMLQHDANADGKLTRAEFDAALRARFNEFDANKDGAATAEEFQAARKLRVEKMQTERFARMDADKNGQLSQAELQAARPDGARDGRDGRGGRRGFGSGGPGRGGPGGPRSDAGGLGPVDADKDARVTFAEFSARAVEGFNRADANKDGTVTIAELQSMTPGRR